MSTLKHFRFIFFIVTLISVYACSDDEAVDTEKPTIDLTITDAFPVSCDTIYFGQPFSAKMLFNDNVELGSFNIDIHHNFDQHTHSTEFEQCEFDLVKTPVNPICIHSRLFYSFGVFRIYSRYTYDASNG